MFMGAPSHVVKLTWYNKPGDTIRHTVSGPPCHGRFDNIDHTYGAPNISVRDLVSNLRVLVLAIFLSMAVDEMCPIPTPNP
jgi:hypothetical protein